MGKCRRCESVLRASASGQATGGGNKGVGTKCGEAKKDVVEV